MTTSPQTLLKSVISLEDVQLTKAQIAYFSAAAQDEAYEEVFQLFVKMSEEDGVTKAFLARRLGKRPEQITRWLSSPSNWTLETLANLLAALGHKAVIKVQKLSEIRQGNAHHPAVTHANLQVVAPPIDQGAPLARTASSESRATVQLEYAHV